MGIKYNILNFKKEDFQTIQGFVAVYDILGYSPWIKENDLFEVAATHENMKKMIKTNTEKFINDSLATLDKPIIAVYSYADTFLIYTNEISDTGFKALLVACNFMFIAAISYGLPIRGATTCGEFYVSETLITGKPIIEAYEKERKQDWIGCWITDECLEKISKEARQEFIKEREIVKYHIPFKDGDVEEVYAYNWIVGINHMYNNAINLEALETKSFLQKKNSHAWREERKHKNTKEFINFILNLNYKNQIGT